MAKEYVPVFFDWLDVTQDLTAEEKGNLIDAVVAYASGKEYEHLLTGGCRIAFRFLKGQVDRNSAISDARSEARKNKPEQNGTNDNKTEQTESNLPKEKEKEKEKENKKDKEKQKRNAAHFTPPTVEEVAEYCQARKNGINPQYFVDYYTARGWELKPGQKVKDWRACVRTWEGHDRPKPGKVIPAADFKQRDYSDVDGQMMEELAAEMKEFKGAG